MDTALKNSKECELQKWETSHQFYRDVYSFLMSIRKCIKVLYLRTQETVC